MSRPKKERPVDLTEDRAEILDLILAVEDELDRGGYVPEKGDDPCAP